MEHKEYTNKQGLPSALCNAITVDHYTDPNDKPSDYSATGLIAPIQQQELKTKYKENLPVRDVTDMLAPWMGSVIHNAIQDSWKKDHPSIVEERLYTEVLGKTISGKFDCLENDGTLIDWKTCKVFKLMKRDFWEWECQANIYAYLCRKNGYEVKRAFVWALALDFLQSEIVKNKDYPRSPAVQVPLKLWSDEEQESYIHKRVSERLRASTMDEQELALAYPCTLYEMWSNLKDYAVTKNGAKRATKLFKTEEEAIEFQKKKGNEYFWEKRMSPRTRCERYCDASFKCQQYKEYCDSKEK